MCICVCICIKLEHCVYGMLRQMQRILCICIKLQTKMHSVNGPLVHSIWITQSHYSSPKFRGDFNRYTIQFLDFSSTSYYNLEHRLTIMSSNFNPLSNSTYALLEFWIWSDAKYTWCYHWWLLVMHNASPGLERSIVMGKPNKMVTIGNRMQLNNFYQIHEIRV